MSLTSGTFIVELFECVRIGAAPHILQKTATARKVNNLTQNEVTQYKKNEIVCKILKEIVLIEPMKAKLVQGVYIWWMAVELKSKNEQIVYTTCYSKITKILLAIMAKGNVIFRKCGGKFEIGRIYFVKRNEHIKKATTFIFLQSNILWILPTRVAKHFITYDFNYARKLAWSVKINEFSGTSSRKITSQTRG